MKFSCATALFSLQTVLTRATYLRQSTDQIVRKETDHHNEIATQLLQDSSRGRKLVSSENYAYFLSWSHADYDNPIFLIVDESYSTTYPVVRPSVTLEQYHYNKAQWLRDEVTNDSFLIRNAATGTCLQVTDPGTLTYTSVTLQTCNESNRNQQFIIQGATYRNVGTDFYLGIQEWFLSSGMQNLHLEAQADSITGIRNTYSEYVKKGSISPYCEENVEKCPKLLGYGSDNLYYFGWDEASRWMYYDPNYSYPTTQGGGPYMEQALSGTFLWYMHEVWSRDKYLEVGWTATYILMKNAGNGLCLEVSNTGGTERDISWQPCEATGETKLLQRFILTQDRTIWNVYTDTFLTLGDCDTIGIYTSGMEVKASKYQSCGGGVTQTLSVRLAWEGYEI